MRYLRCLVSMLLIIGLSGCSYAQSKNNRLPTAYALEGTSTAVVGIAVDRKGYPKETVSEIVLRPGQKVFFAGPDDFQLAFKNKKSPTDVLEYKSNDGSIKIEIPKDILERPEYAEEFRKNKFIRFDYSINVKGRELDPPIIIRRDG